MPKNMPKNMNDTVGVHMKSRSVVIVIVSACRRRRQTVCCVPTITNHISLLTRPYLASTLWEPVVPFNSLVFLLLNVGPMLASAIMGYGVYRSGSTLAAYVALTNRYSGNVSESQPVSSSKLRPLYVLCHL
jgi:hypothetical protein